MASTGIKSLEYKWIAVYTQCLFNTFLSIRHKDSMWASGVWHDGNNAFQSLQGLTWTVCSLICSTNIDLRKKDPSQTVCYCKWDKLWKSMFWTPTGRIVEQNNRKRNLLVWLVVFHSKQNKTTNILQCDKRPHENVNSPRLTCQN